MLSPVDRKNGMTEKVTPVQAIFVAGECGCKWNAPLFERSQSGESKRAGRK
jgi:hypothetical protein